MVIPLVDTPQALYDEHRNRSRRVGPKRSEEKQGFEESFVDFQRVRTFPDCLKMSLFACTNCNSRHPFEQLSKGDQLCKVSKLKLMSKSLVNEDVQLSL